MTVEDADVVDFISVDGKTGDVVLTISDHLSGESDEHVIVLQEKLNKYLVFVESGELLKEYEQAKDRRPHIRIVFKHTPSAIGREFLARASQLLRKAGIVFSYETRSIQ